MLPLLCGARDPAAAGGGGGGGGEGETLIAIVTVTNASASGKSGEPVEFGFPLAATELAAGAFLKLYDDDGVGGQGDVLANHQFDNHATDLDNAVRFAKGSCILPSLGASATRKLRVVRATGAAPVNTAITVADILATSYEVSVDFNIAGTAFTAAARTALGGVSSWSASTGRTDAVTHGNWRQNGACTEIICSMPPRSGGVGTEHASGNGIRVWFHVAAWKAGAGAVGAGNPITYVRTRVVLENGALERAAPAQYWYGLGIRRATSLVDGTLVATDDMDVDGNVIQYDWPRSQPATTLTLSLAAVGSRTFARQTGSWPLDIKGAHILNAGGAGKSYVKSRTSATELACEVYEAFSAESYNSGAWSIEGIGQPYGTRWFEDVHIGTRPSNVAVPGDVSSAVAPTGNGLRDRLRTTRLVHNYQSGVADIAHNMTNLNASRANARLRPFTVNGPEGVFLGDTDTDQGKSGRREDIAVIPEWDVAGFTKYDANGRRKIFENGRWLCMERWHCVRPYTASLADGGRGVPASPASGMSYKFNPSHGQPNQINLPALSWLPYDGDISHMPSFGFVSYLLTGDLFWLETLQFKIPAQCTFGYHDGYNGTGINKTHFGSALRDLPETPFGENQMRGMAWGARDVAQATICTPDSSRDLIYVPKATLKTFMQKHWDAARSGDLNTDAGLNRWTAHGFHWTNISGSSSGFGSGGTGQASPYMSSYLIWALGHIRELGLSDADFNAFMDWLAVNIEESYASADVAPDFMTTAYSCAIQDFGSNTYLKTWAGQYRKSALVRDTSDGGFSGNNRSYIGRRRAGTAAQTVVLTATSGASVVVTLPAASFANGGSAFYIDGSNGGWIELMTDATTNATVSAYGRITAISPTHTSDRQVTIDTTGSPAFSGTSIAANLIQLPAPHPSDAGPDGSAGLRSVDYMQLYAISAAMLMDFGRGAPASSARAYITASTGYTAPLADGVHRYNIAPR